MYCMYIIEHYSTDLFVEIPYRYILLLYYRWGGAQETSKLPVLSKKVALSGSTIKKRPQLYRIPLLYQFRWDLITRKLGFPFSYFSFANCKLTFLSMHVVTAASSWNFVRYMKEISVSHSNIVQPKLVWSKSPFGLSPVWIFIAFINDWIPSAILMNSSILKKTHAALLKSET